MNKFLLLAATVLVAFLGLAGSALAALPEVAVTDVSTITGSEATIIGTVDPNDADSTWTFEYGTTTSYGNQQPGGPQTVSAGPDPVRVLTRLNGLSPGTTYHYRLTATNLSGTTNGEDHTFTTVPNNTSGGVDTTRGYELVSPPDKRGNAVDPLYSVQAAPDGNSVAYAATGGLPGNAANMAGGYYIGRRADAGWSLNPLDPPQNNVGDVLATPTLMVSDDLGRAVQYSSLALAPGAVADGGNLFERDNLTGTRRTVLGSPERAALARVSTGGSRPLPDATADLSHFVFTSQGALVPGVDATKFNVYELTGGQIRLVNRLPDGSPTPDGGSIQTAGGIGQPYAISDDGRRIFFHAGQTTSRDVLYMRVDGQTTVPLSVSHRSGSEGTPEQVFYDGASSDGSIVYFETDALLTNEDQSGVYRLNVDTNELTVVSPGANGPPAILGGTFAVSDDGSTVYFTALDDLVGDSSFFPVNVYSSRHGHLSRIGTAPFPEEFSIHTRALSPNGRYLALNSSGSTTGFDNGGLPAVFVWDADTQKLACASCDPAGKPYRARLFEGSARIAGHEQRAALDDGSVFFSTTAPLVEQDVNGREDVYRWKDGVNTLITTGKDNADATFADATPDGRSVFFTTTARLVGLDADDDIDLYVARVGGGLPSQNEPSKIDAPCVADACQGAPQSGGLSAPIVGSVTFIGPGDDLSPPAAKSAGRARVSASKTARGSRFSISVKVPAPGTVKVAGSGLVATSKTLREASSTKVTVALTRQARAKLKRHRTLKIAARVSYIQAGKPASTTTVSVTLKA